MAQNVKKGLGRGLDALLGNYDEQPQDSVLMADISLVDNDPNQPRKDFDPDKLDELAASIKRHGVVQPILVRKKDGRYIIIAGERRFRAAKMAGLAAVPVIVKTFLDEQILEIALIENIQRENLNPIEEAAAIRFLMNQHDLTQDEVSDRLGKSRPAIANTLRLLTLGHDVQQFVRDGRLTAGAARSLLPIKDSAAQTKLAQEVVSRGLTVREIERIVSKCNTPPSPNKAEPKQEQDADVLAAARQLGEKLGTRVNILGDAQRGKVVIEYYSNDSLCSIYETIIGE